MTFSIQFHAGEPHLTENLWKLKDMIFEKLLYIFLFCLKWGKTPDGNDKRHLKKFHQDSSST